MCLFTGQYPQVEFQSYYILLFIVLITIINGSLIENNLRSTEPILDLAEPEAMYHAPPIDDIIRQFENHWYKYIDLLVVTRLILRCLINIYRLDETKFLPTEKRNA